MVDARRFWNTLLRVVVVGSVAVTLVVGGFAITHLETVSRLFQVAWLIRSQALEPPGADTLVEGATAGMVQALQDPYSEYLDTESFRQLEQHITGTYGGVGLLIGLDEEKRIRVESPFKGAPGQRAGIAAGDYILRIDDQDTAGMDLNKAALLMKGEPGTKVRLTIYRQGKEQPWEVALTREIVNIPSVEGQLLKGQPGVAYISLSNFSEHTAGELKGIIDELAIQGMRGLVLDMRSNPGGSLNAAVGVADLFLRKGPVVYVVDRRGAISLESNEQSLGLPLAVLVNEGTASAAEIVTGAIKDTGVGTVVGEKTFGKGIVQTVFEMQGPTAVKLTTARYLTPSKVDIHKKGIQPDVLVPLSPEEEARLLGIDPQPKDDPQLRKALEVLSEKMRQ